MTAPIEYIRPPARTSASAVISSFSSCEIAASATQPSESPITAESHFGVSSQKSFSRIAASAPTQTIDRTGIAQPVERTSRPNGV